ncbi:MAG TPA: glycosyltransferase family 39 protein [Vicinamibacterales bacterium]|nr:glycosyltransferase family 39 protein [Vicinamibacterales bacterium]
MIRMGLAALLVAYAPGALLFRTPLGARPRRADLPAEERVFWYVVLSAGLSLAIAIALAWLGRYRFDRLLIANGTVCAATLILVRGRLRFRGTSRRPTWTVVLPIALVALGIWRFFPTSEYIIGGKDPGTYVNEGIQIAQRGALVIHDPVVAAVPEDARPLFFPPYLYQPYDSLRFMGFFVEHVRDGEVVGQLPHLFPASIAVGYGLNGLTGARDAVAVWALLGLVAVYVFAARLLGPIPAFAAAALLALHVIQVWFARYPNSEVTLQALLFATLLAYSRAHEDGDGFFAPIAGLLAALLIFARLDGVMVVAALAGVAVLSWIAAGTRPRASFVLTMGAGTLAGLLYLKGPLHSYAETPTNWVRGLAEVPGLIALASAAVIAALVVLVVLRRRAPAALRTALPIAIAAVLLAAAGYAWFLRAPGGRLTDYDAYALRTFTNFYLFPVGLVATLAGVLLVARQSFWRAPAFVVVFAGFALSFFYKIHVVPEHFWMARRFLPIILPGAFVFMAAAALGPAIGASVRGERARLAAGAVLLLWLGSRYAAAAAPILPHVEYAGVIPYLERLASEIGDRDLVIVESRDSNADTHVFAVPLAYIYARNVLVLVSPKPDKRRLEAFIAEAHRTYDHVLFVGGGGTDLLSRHIIPRAIDDGRVEVPEWASTPWNVYPAGPRRKDFNYSLYELTVGEAQGGAFDLDVGDRDDLYVVRFFAKESSEGRSIRWTGPTSFISVPGLSGQEREVVLTMHDGGRPASAPPARVTVRFDGVVIGTIDVGSGFRDYRLAIPAELVERAAAKADPAQLTLESTTWVPRDVIGGTDDRTLGVMLDRVQVH